ncbi:MAG TPA: hypothetical protein VKX96_13975 [Chloroflexota bacterium]|nr:hypothetical protein [Chloroflexota bacterium]
MTGEADGEIWAIECKHRRGALTRPMVERFWQSARAIEQARGIRPDANQVATAEGILRSGRRHLEALARHLNEPRNELDRARTRG